MSSKHRGFTLIEMMIVVSIIGILAAIAYPSYLEYVRKGRRADAMSALQQIQLAQAKWRANNTTYGNLAQVYGNKTTTPAPQSTYTLAISNITATGFEATATPNAATGAGKDQANDKCKTFVINQDGPVTNKGTGYADANCWK